jgi:hypothetical protein
MGMNWQHRNTRNAFWQDIAEHGHVYAQCVEELEKVIGIELHKEDVGNGIFRVSLFADAQCKLLFTYGIFRHDRMHEPPATWEHVGNKIVDGYTIYQFHGSGVAMARPREGAHIEGTLWRLPASDVFNWIDHVEGHPHWYKRTLVETRDGIACEMYVMQQQLEHEKAYVDTGPVWRP